MFFWQYIGNGLSGLLGTVRHDKKLNFDTSVFLEDPKLTRKQRDLRQKIYSDKPKNQKIYTLGAQIDNIVPCKPFLGLRTLLGLKCSHENSITPKSCLQLSKKL